MARRLLGAGFPVTVYNRTREKAAALAIEGAWVGSTPRDAVNGAQIVFSMVADDAASRALWLGDEGALAGIARGTRVVECSTLSVGWVTELAHAARAAGGEFVDAPVTGSKQAAAAGELSFLVGGSPAAVEALRPALMAMGRAVTHFGPAGSGALVKLLNNFLAGVHVAAWAEAMAWLERTGVDREKAVGFLLEAAPGSPVTKIVAARMKAEDYTPNFFLRLMAKDLEYAIAEAAKKDLELQSAAMAAKRFREAIAAGYGDADMAAIVKAVRASKP